MIDFFGHGELKDVSNPDALHEANLLMLNIDKAKSRLGWAPALTARQSIELTSDWYKRYRKEDAYSICIDEIEKFLHHGNHPDCL